jgi:hypothetical protein
MIGQPNRVPFRVVALQLSQIAPSVSPLDTITMRLSRVPGRCCRGGSVCLTWPPLALSASLVALAFIVVLPYEMDTIVGLLGTGSTRCTSGCTNTVVGIGILLGNLVTGGAWTWPERHT